jgi:hypothetical protein
MELDQVQDRNSTTAMTWMLIKKKARPARMNIYTPSGRLGGRGMDQRGIIGVLR